MFFDTLTFAGLLSMSVVLFATFQLLRLDDRGR